MSFPRRMSSDLSPHEIERRAIAKFGQPNRAASNRRELRFGRKGSVSVDLSGPKAGAWYDFENDEGGYLHQGDEPRRIRRPRPVNDNRTNENDERSIKEARRIAWEGRQATASDRTGVYLPHRGIANLNDVKSHHGPTYFGKRYEGGALFVATDASGLVNAAQIVQLAKDGTKAKVDAVKRTFGRPKLGYARFGPRGAGATFITFIAEGPESLLSAREAFPDARHLCSFGSIRIDLEDPDFKDARRVVVLADRDARERVRKKVEALAAERPDIEWRIATAPDEVAPDDPKADANDVLKSGGVEAVRTMVENAERIGDLIDFRYPDYGRTLLKAEGAVAAAMERFKKAVLSVRDQGGDPPKFGVSATQGVGKTRQALKTAIEVSKAGPVIVAVSSHKLGEELVERIQREGGRARQIYGMDSGTNGTPSCLKCPIVETLRKMGVTIKSAMCESDGEYCEHHPKNPARRGPPCLYRQQWAGLDEPMIYVVTHAHLTVRDGGAPIPKNPVAIFVDEDPSGALVDASGGATPFDLLRAPPDLMVSTKGRRHSDIAATNDLRDELGRIERVLEKPKPTLADLAAEGITTETLETAYKMIGKDPRLHAQPFTPGTPDAQRRRKLDDFDARLGDVRKKLRSLRRILHRLKRCIETGAPPHQTIVVSHEDAGRVIRTYFAKELKTGAAPVMFLDGTADRDILSALVGDIDDWTDARADTPKAFVRQVVSHRFSRNMLLGPSNGSEADEKRAENHRRRVAALIEGEAKKRGAGKVGVITYKGLVERLRDEQPHLDELGIEWGWFGGQRGLNAFEHVDALLVFGRNIPSKQATENRARAIFANTSVELNIEGDGGVFAKRKTAQRMRDRSRQTVDAEHHSCPMVEKVRAQLCDAELSQAIHRARPVRRAVEVTIYTNNPVDVTVDAVEDWDVIAPDRFVEAWARDDGVMLWSAGELSRRHGDLWRSPKAAKEALKHLRGRLDIKGPNPNRDPYWGWGLLSEARYWTGASQKKPFTAWVPKDVADPRKALEAIVGPVLRVEFDGVEASAAVPALDHVGAEPVHDDPPPIVADNQGFIEDCADWEGPDLGDEEENWSVSPWLDETPPDEPPDWDALAPPIDEFPPDYVQDCAQPLGDGVIFELGAYRRAANVASAANFRNYGGSII